VAAVSQVRIHANVHRPAVTAQVERRIQNHLMHQGCVNVPLGVQRMKADLQKAFGPLLATPNRAAKKFGKSSKRLYDQDLLLDVVLALYNHRGTFSGKERSASWLNDTIADMHRQIGGGIRELEKEIRGIWERYSGKVSHRQKAAYRFKKRLAAEAEEKRQEALDAKHENEILKTRLEAHLAVTRMKDLCTSAGVNYLEQARLAEMPPAE